MTDKKNNHDHDEYQFPADEYVSSAEEHAKAGAPEPEFHEEEPLKSPHQPVGILERFPLLAHKKFLLMVAGALVVLIAYKMMQPPVMQKVVATPAPQRVVKREVSPQMTSELSDLQQALQTNQASVNQLQTQLQSVNSVLSQNAQTEASNQVAIRALTQQVSVLAGQVKALQAVGSKIPVAQFHVKAIVSGRAWIVNSHGLEQTVRVGDIVPSYGEVTAIDPSRGQVTTNSGKIIRFGTNDA